MVFIARFEFPERNPATRAYLHSAGFKELFTQETLNAKNYLLEVLEINNELIKKHDYILTAIWGNVEENKHMIDIFCYSVEKNKEWPGNPNVTAWTARDKYLFLPRGNITCGDTLIMLGEEEKYQREP